MSDITRRLRGKRVAAVESNGHVLKISTEDGAEIDIVWLDDNGYPIKGKPSVQLHGLRLIAAGLKDLIHYPAIRERGHA